MTREIAVLVVSAACAFPALANAEAHFGYNGEFYRQDGGAQQLAAAKAGGADTVRYGISWSGIQPQRDGSMNWGWADTLYERTLAAGLRPVILLDGSPCWARTQTPCGSTIPFTWFRYADVLPDKDALPAWGRFVAEATARYPKARAFEIWNEPNLGIFGGPGTTPESYAPVLQAAYINAAPGARILYAGLCPCGDWLGWLTTARTEGAGYMSDGLALHIYPSLGQKWVATAGRTERLGYRAFGKKPVWVTEIGESTWLVSDAKQTHDLVGMWDRLDHRRGVKTVDIFNLRDATKAPKDDALHNNMQQNIGVETLDGTPKPAYEALRDAVLRR